MFVDSQGERCTDYSVYALQKSRNGSLFLPVLHYDSSQKVIRYWWAISSNLERATGRDLGGEGGLGLLLEDQFVIQLLESTIRCQVRFERRRIDFGAAIVPSTVGMAQPLHPHTVSSNCTSTGAQASSASPGGEITLARGLREGPWPRGMVEHSASQRVGSTVRGLLWSG